MTENATTPNPAFPPLIGALFALGAAFIGWQAGLGLYSAIYEYLRNSGGEMMLESTRTLATFRYCGWFAGAALAALVFCKAILLPYDAVGKARFVWVKIAFPENQTRYKYDEIKVELRTPTQNVKCFATFWENEDGRTILPMRCDFTELTPDREVVVTLPGAEPITLKMPFARNPKPMHNYSGWIRTPGGMSFIYRVT